ncbi:type I polyketide synthase [Amycolatopsis plumensis]|uniref:Type I polyketide synthase n=1 Tax=Amycolatopsis plumensis TaxID=236508 RepID=A0ABV5TX73_9PSEU
MGTTVSDGFPGDGRDEDLLAVVGLSCRLPGADGPAAFWRLLTGGVDAVGTVPPWRWGPDAPPDDAGGTPLRAGGFIEDADRFDAGFFGISAREAVAMDPRQRLTLELGWEALEDAHIVPAAVRGTAAGVFVGAIADDYAAVTRQHGTDAITHHSLAGLHRGLIANRLSHALGVTGPSLTVDTAQSSSLVAVHLAAESLRRGESEVALAGGVHLNLSWESALTLERFGGLSPDGRCHTFDARANGFVRGEGGGFVVLKTLRRARRDGDRIYCVLRGSAMNHDGDDADLVVPSAAAQERVIRAAVRRAAVEPAALQYVELHGTGTRTGDPIEAAALGAALGEHGDAPVRVGSVKTNIGHLEGAAGIAGLLKTVLCVHHRKLVPSLHFETPNPEIPWDTANIEVQRGTEPWPRERRPLVAGVSSFGVGGANCHVVLAESGEPAPAAATGDDSSAVVPWVVSARSAAALREQAARLGEYADSTEVSAADIGFSLAVTRSAFEHRAAVVGADRAELAAAVRGIGQGGAAGIRGVADVSGPTVFVFPGQGAQWAGMAVGLLGSAPVFAARMAECADAFAELVDWSLTDALADPALLERVDVVQPVSFAVMVSLAALWESYGIHPAAVVGHSQGEIAAACVAGALSLRDAARVVVLRSRVIREQLAGSGGMASIGLSEREVTARIAGSPVTVAAVNGPSSVVVAGEPAALDELVANLEADGVRAKRVPVDYASHSVHVAKIEESLTSELGALEPRVPRVPWLSTVTGEWIETATVDARYWYANLRQPVRFEAAVRTLAAAGHAAFVEVSSHPVLLAGTQETLDDVGAGPSVVAGTLRRDEGGLARFLTSLAELHVRGVEPDWAAVFPGGVRVDLPTYAFQRKRYWPGDAVEDDVPVTPSLDPLDVVRAHAAAVLGHGDPDAIGRTTTFKEAGFDSVMSVELRNRLSAATGLALPAGLLFDRPTPHAVAEHLAERLAGEPAGARRAGNGTRTKPAPDEPIAIVGMACRFPGGVRSPEQLWRLVADEVDAIGAFPEDRGWDLRTLRAADGRRGSSATDQGGFLYDAAEFDADFFGISPREATAMDPQQRLLLETSWEAVERAGIDPSALRGSDTGVFVGIMSQEYGPRLAEGAEGYEGHLLTGNTASVASGRLAYTLGLHGPALTVDTACSSSLVALHSAVRSLRAGECGLALAGGATVLSSPGIFVEFSRQQGLAADGRCRAFADGADGTGWAEGAGVLLLERLADARRAGHPVLAVVRGSAVNSDGASNGLTAPSGPAQQSVIRAALADAGLGPEDVDSVEAHGTGTTLGDPIEAEALLATYGRHRPADRPLWLGSLKSNIGHAQAAAGVGGVIKMVQAMRNATLPRTLHADEPSSRIDWSAGTIRLLGEARAWPAADRPRRAAVSSFGISGTNAHVVLEQAEEPAEEPPRDTGSEPVLPWVLSGRGADALRAQAGRLVSRVTSMREPRAADLAHSLATTRFAAEHRAVAIGAGCAEPLAALREFAEGVVPAGLVEGTANVTGRTVFVFPGQGAQWAGMALELLDTAPVFAARMAECAAALSEFTDWSLPEALRDEAMLARVDVVQPVSFAVMVSLAALWQATGIEPDAVVGHSQGEIAAACVSGALSLRDAAAVVVLRSKAIHDELAGHGGMVSVSLSASDTERLIEDWAGRIGIAVFNGPTATVVAGEPAALDELLARCAADGIRARRVPVDYASHSGYVESLRQQLLDELAFIEPMAARVPFLSTVTGEWTDTATLDAGYWYENLRRPVRFEAATRALAAQGFRVFVESSPHPVLGMAVQETVDELGAGPTVVVGTLRRNEGGLRRFYTSLAELYVRGVTPDWSAVFGGHRPRRVDLPTYAFQRRRYWLSPEQPSTAGTDPVERRFWTAVERSDVGELAKTLAVGEDEVRPLVPALSAWRSRRNAETVADALRYRIEWEPVRPGGAGLSGDWAVLAPAEGADVLDDVVAALEAGGARATVVRVPDTADRTWFAESLRDSASAAGLVSLLAMDERPHARFGVLTAGLAATVELTAALRDLPAAGPLWVLTRAAVTTGRNDRLDSPDQAAVWGFGRTAALEFPRRWGGLLDLPPVLDGRAAGRLCAALAGFDGEDQLALRSSGLFARRLVPAPVGDTAPATPWRPGGTVLVTGGTGGLGGHLARWFADAGADHVVLTGRRGLDTPGAAELRDELTAQGARITVAACDVTDAGALEALLDGLAADGEPVRTVVHAAGIAPLTPIGELTVAEVAEVAEAKVAGVRNLDALLGDRELDTLVLFSSISATWGVGEHAAYAAANAFLDAFAEQRRAEGLPVLSVAWGPWAGGGMIAEHQQDVLRRRGVPVLDPEPALAGLRQALDRRDTVVALAELDRARFVSTFASVRPSPLLARLGGADDEAARAEPSGAEEPSLVRRLAHQRPEEAKRVVTELVRAHTARALGHDDPSALELGKAFKDLGFDSLTSVELRNRLGAATGLPLPATLVFDHPTPSSLADHLLALARGAEPGAGPRAGTTAAPVAGDEIAIVAASCRLPGGIGSPEQLWDLLARGGDVMSGLPADRGWDPGVYDPDPDRPGTSYTRTGGFLHDSGDFDAEFFGMSPREALATDPQQRLLLELTWEAMERAGLPPESLRGSRTGVYVGVTDQYYGDPNRNDPERDEGYLVTGDVASVASGRIAYVFGLEGPAVTLDTACSSSLAALHLAANALRSGECSLAVAAGAMVMATPSQFIAFSRQRGLAEDGHCKPFSARADGFALAEGAAVVLVERLSDARRLGHPVLAVVRGSAMNSDGASNGLTAPNGRAQQRVIRDALAAAGLEPSEVDAVEAHGTGTTLGDPIEANALLATYGEGERAEPLWLGSVKANVGHTQTVSGLVGVLKMIEAMRHGVLPRSPYAEDPTPHVDWSGGTVALLAGERPWPERGRVRRSGVSAFGISGTNVHVILEQPPAGPEPDAGREPVPGTVPLVLSGRTDSALRAQAASLLAVVEDAAHPLDDLAFSLATSRSAFEHRAVVLAEDHESAARGLAALAGGTTAPGVFTGFAATGPAAWLFSGQGAQHAGMGERLYETYDVFADAVDAACARFDALLGADGGFADRPLREVMFAGEGTADAALLDHTAYTQPALFTFEVALYRLLESWGLAPGFLVGHSIGELAAAHVAGVFSLDDACTLVAARGRLMQSLPEGGAMVAIEAAAAEVEPLLPGSVSLAAVNGPASVVVSGDEDAVTALAGRFAADGRRTKRLRTSHAFHSPRMDAMLAEFGRVAAGLSYGEPRLPVVSTVTGELADPALLRTPGYWVGQVRATVRFADAVGHLAGLGVARFLEVGPAGVLTALAAETVDRESAVLVAASRADRDEVAAVLGAVATLHVAGSSPDWRRWFAGRPVHRVPLPTYAFQRRRYWLRPSRRRQEAMAGSWQYGIEWRPVPDAGSAVLDGTWLVPMPSGGNALAHRLLAGLRAAGAAVVPLRADQLGEVAAVVAQQRFAGVLSLLALDGRDDPRCAPLSRGLADTVTLLGALGESAPPVWCVTASAVATAEGEPVGDAAQGAVWGLGAVLGLERPAQWGGLIDVPSDVDDAGIGRLVAVLAGGHGEDQVAVRASGTSARRLVRAPFGSETTGGWRPRGAVLVTGGLGALGARVARWLAEEGAEHLVLVSRRGEEAPGAAELAAELAGHGAGVTILGCDVGDQEAFSALLTSLPERLPDGVGVTAVVHTAGVAQEPRPLEQLSLTEFAEIARAKLGGARVLDAFFADEPLDAFVLFSSVSAVWGNHGSAAYAGANGFLDALAQQRRARGLAATSIAWGAWGGGGMVDGETAELYRRRGVPVMAPETAVGVLGSAVRGDRAHVVCADVDWATFVPAYTMARPRPLLNELPEASAAPAEPAAAPAEAGGPPAFVAKLLDALAEDRLPAALDLVRAATARVLGHDDIRAAKPFKELGVDSLTGVELRDELGSATGLSLPATIVFDQPTPRALAEHLCERVLAEYASPAPLAEQLEQLERALDRTPPPEEVRARLRELAQRWGVDSRSGVPADIDEATDDEIFDLIEQELGAD